MKQMLIEKAREAEESETLVGKKTTNDLERWVQLVMGFIYLGLLFFTVQTVSVKVRLQLQLDGQLETKPSCYQRLL